MERTFLLALIALILVTCRKKDDPVPYWGEVSASINGQSWNQQFTMGQSWRIKISGVPGNDVSNHPCNQNTFGLQIHRFNSEDLWREALSFTKIPRQPGTYALTGEPGPCEIDTLPAASFATLQDDGDVLQDYYVLVKAENNYVTVNSFNASNGEVSGTFGATFVIDSRSKLEPSSLPDTLRFTNGQFHTRFRLKNN